MTGEAIKGALKVFSVLFPKIFNRDRPFRIPISKSSFQQCHVSHIRGLSLAIFVRRELQKNSRVHQNAQEKLHAQARKIRKAKANIKPQK
jgi:hypothetical protein